MLIRGVTAKLCTLVPSVASTAAVAPLEITFQCCGAVTRTSKVALRSGWSKQANIALGVGGFELRIQVGLVVHRVDEAVQALAGVGVAAVGVDDHDVAVGQPAQRDAGRFVVPGDVELAPVEGGAAHGFGGDVDDRVGAGERVEHHGGGGAKVSFAGRHLDRR